jgi:hypothetical protein
LKTIKHAMYGRAGPELLRGADDANQIDRSPHKLRKTRVKCKATPVASSHPSRQRERCLLGNLLKVVQVRLKFADPLLGAYAVEAFASAGQSRKIRLFLYREEPA